MKSVCLLIVFLQSILLLVYAEERQDFQLEAGHFVPARMPMHAVFPRPDSETQTHARHRWAHPGLTYEVPIGVQGGAWPFKYELLEAPKGAVIGERYGDKNYGSISWLAPESGSFAFKVQVTDQELNVLVIEWQVAVSAEPFVFIQDGWDGTRVGSLAEPLEDIADWFKGDVNDATFHNKIIVFRAGAYKLQGDQRNKLNVRLLNKTKTPSFIAYPGEKPVVDCSSAKIMTDNKGLQDMFVAGIKWIDGRQDVKNAHIFWAVGDVSRSCWWRNHFHNLGPGKVGNDNTMPVFVSGTRNRKANILYKENLHTEIQNFGKNGAYFEAYVSDYVLIEENVAKNCMTAAGWFAKGTVSFVTIRANVAVENVQGGQIKVGYGGEARSVPHDHEVCWNRVVTSDKKNVPIFQWCGSNYYGGKTYHSWIYRNTFVGGSSWIRFAGKEKFVVDGNLVVTDMPQRWGAGNHDETYENVIVATDAGVVDDQGLLTGPFRKKSLGTIGSEVD